MENVTCSDVNSSWFKGMEAINELACMPNEEILEYCFYSENCPLSIGQLHDNYEGRLLMNMSSHSQVIPEDFLNEIKNGFDCGTLCNLGKKELPCINHFPDSATEEQDKLVIECLFCRYVRNLKC